MLSESERIRAKNFLNQNVDDDNLENLGVDSLIKHSKDLQPNIFALPQVVAKGDKRTRKNWFERQK